MSTSVATSLTSMTITRALTELKTLDKRIQKEIDSGTFVSYQGKFHQPDVYAKTADTRFQSITDLIDRRSRIKSLIISSNARTMVRVCNKDMSVAEAIETKSSLKHRKNLLAVLKRQYGDINRTIESINANARRELESKSSRGLEGTGDKMNLTEFSNTYMDMHGVRIYDPIGIASRIERLEQFITEFENEVDYTLAEKNSVTTITV